MRIAYLDCASGISGDMTLGALIDAGADLATIQQGIDSLGLPSCRLVTAEVKKKGFRATQLTIEHEPEHAHRHLHHITAMIDKSILTPPQKDLATRIFNRLAEAEAKVHGSTIQKVHFHEVGAVDSIADIVGTAIAFDLLGIEEVMASPIPTGTGFVTIAHGRCSIPAPATAELLKGIPLADFAVEGELTTPTGAAIVSTLVREFGPLPAMTVSAIGFGSGQKDFAHANLLRILIGERAATNSELIRDMIILLETNLDDTSGELIGRCAERLWEAGALDVSLAPIQMKKGRPGVLLAVQGRPADADKLERIIFEETTTLGVRCQQLSRHTLPREKGEVTTAWGQVTGVVATLPGGAKRFAPEYESCRKLSQDKGVPLAQIYAAAAAAFAS